MVRLLTSTVGSVGAPRNSLGDTRASLRPLDSGLGHVPILRAARAAQQMLLFSDRRGDDLGSKPWLHRIVPLPRRGILLSRRMLPVG